MVLTRNSVDIREFGAWPGLVIIVRKRYTFAPAPEAGAKADHTRNAFAGGSGSDAFRQRGNTACPE